MAATTATTSGATTGSRCTRPAAVSAVLALCFAPLGSTVPGAHLDPSWQLGMSWGAAQSIPPGRGLVFTYGPWGFLAVPNIAWRPGLIMGLAYILVGSFAFYFLAYSA